MKDNPFNSKTFVNFWISHFLEPATIVNFDFLEDLSFYKSSSLPLYTNTGRNLTKGISYELCQEDTSDFAKSVALIYDVPEFFGIKTEPLPEGLGLYRVKQYPGFLIDLEGYNSLVDYLGKQFKKSSRYKLKKYRKRLESSFDIRYKTYYGDIEKEVYEEVFNSFRELLEKRFDEKQIRNNNLDPDEWEFYKDVAYPMILEKKASLFVIYQGDKPIGVTLNYLNGEVVFDAITVFDIDYSKFHVGSVTIMAQIEWCLEHGKKILDFSKGYFDYKKRWANLAYDFEYHIYYDRRSFKARSLAWMLYSVLKLKQSLREKKINEKLHRFTYWLKNRRKSDPGMANIYRLEDLPVGTTVENTELIPFEDITDVGLKKSVFEFLYLKQEHINNLKIYKNPGIEGGFVFEGNSSRASVYPV